MFLHLGQETVIEEEKIVGIFDIDRLTVTQRARDYLFRAEKDGKIRNVSTELPKSFIVTLDGTVYISQLSVQTLVGRMDSLTGIIT